jgi:bifunctional DNA-binding transcriptional regulator/antitoxin component of YhaV-PrlF toxin-antitoxin module
MSITVKDKTNLVVPERVRRQAGIKAGDRVKFKVSSRTITITTVEAPTYKPTKSELTAIQKGEAQIARGDYVSLTDFLHNVDRHRRKGGAKATRKISG